MENFRDLTRKNEYTNFLLELCPVPISIQYEDKIIYINPAGVLLFHANSARELIGKSVWDFVVPEQREVVPRHKHQIERNNKEFRWLELKIQALDGTIVNVETAGTPFTYQGGSFVQSVYRDITEFKRVEDALAIHQTVIDGLAEPVMVIEPDFNIKLMNKAARAFLYSRPESSEPKLCYRVSHQREEPCDGKEHPCPMQQVYELGQPVTLVYDHYQANGERRFIELVAAPYRDKDGNVRGIIESMRDVSKRIHAENAMRLYTEHLREMAMQLAEKEDLERRRLAQELHDQVGQNLAILGLNLNIVHSLWPDVVEEARNRIDDSLSLVEQVTEQIRDVMANLRSPVLDDYGLVAALRWYAEQFTRRTSIAISVESECAEARLPQRIENTLFRIAQEALTNVAKHAEATHVTISLEVENSTLRFIVTDDGVGFNLAMLSESDEKQGWGFLTMTERAEAIGGHCRIESYPNRGTKISVEITL